MGAMAQRVYDADSRWTNTGINVFCNALTKLLTIEMVARRRGQASVR